MHSRKRSRPSNGLMYRGPGYTFHGGPMANRYLFRKRARKYTAGRKYSLPLSIKAAIRRPASWSINYSHSILTNTGQSCWYTHERDFFINTKYDASLWGAATATDPFSGTNPTYLLTGTGTAPSPKTRYVVISNTLVFNCKNTYTTPLNVEMYFVSPRDCVESSVNASAVTTAGQGTVVLRGGGGSDNVPLQYLYDGWKQENTASDFNQSGIDLVTLVPTASAGNAASTSHLDGVLAPTDWSIYQSSGFLKYFKIKGKKKFHLQPGEQYSQTLYGGKMKIRNFDKWGTKDVNNLDQLSTGVIFRITGVIGHEQVTEAIDDSYTDGTSWTRPNISTMGGGLSIIVRKQAKFFSLTTDHEMLKSRGYLLSAAATLPRDIVLESANTVNHEEEKEAVAS